MNANEPQDSSLEKKPSEQGPVSIWLEKKSLPHKSLEPDHLGVEILEIKPENLFETAEALKLFGFDYLQCQGGYDEGLGKRLACFYQFIAMSEIANNYSSNKVAKAREVRIKVFLNREGEPSLPSLYSLFHGADWQERETFDMFGIHFEGHPHPKRLLMPEDWKGWPLRKDYIQPDFYEMQDAY